MIFNKVVFPHPFEPTKQACSFRDNYKEFKSKDVVVIGISKDSIKSHTNFAKKHDLPFILW